jgi:hypothetical protein
MRSPDRFGDRDADGEAGVDGLFAQAADVCQEPVRAAGRVRPHENLRAAAVGVGIWAKAWSSCDDP